MKNNKTDTYTIIIDCSKDNEIKTNTNYEFKFMKSVFVREKKRIISDFLKNQYGEKFLISNQFKIDNNRYKYTLKLK